MMSGGVVFVIVVSLLLDLGTTGKKAGLALVAWLSFALHQGKFALKVCD